MARSEVCNYSSINRLTMRPTLQVLQSFLASPQSLKPFIWKDTLLWHIYEDTLLWRFFEAWNIHESTSTHPKLFGISMMNNTPFQRLYRREHTPFGSLSLSRKGEEGESSLSKLTMKQGMCTLITTIYFYTRDTEHHIADLLKTKKTSKYSSPRNETPKPLICLPQFSLNFTYLFIHLFMSKHK